MVTLPTAQPNATDKSGINPQYNYGGVPVISSETMGGASSPSQFQTYTPPPIDTSATTPMELTVPEQEAQGEFDALRTVQNELLGESAYRTEQENAQGIAEKKQAVSDLSSRLKTLQNEALALPIQLQQESIGRGRTAGGLAPLESAALRNNAIQALSVNSLLEASRGNLTTALDLADRAVKQKYDPIREKINVTKANLELIMQSPAYSLADKNRAQKQLDIQNARERRLRLEEEDEKIVLSLMSEAIKNNPTASAQIQMAVGKSPEQALTILAPYLKDPNATRATLLDLENKRLQNRNLQEGINEKAKENGVGSVDVSGLNPVGRSIAETVKNLRFQSKDEAKRIMGNVNARLAVGDTEGALETLKQFGYQKLSVGQQNDFDLYDSAQSAFRSAAGQIEAQNLKAGPYKALLEKAKPFTAIKNDKAYADLRSIIELGQAQLRKGFYGTAVTGTESANARNFLIVDTDPIDVIRWKLENGANFLDFTNDATIARTTGLPKPNIDDYLTYRVREKSSGQTGSIPRSEYNPNDYEIIK